MEQRITTQNQQNWIARLLGYNFEIVYKSRVTNKVVDALSQKEVTKEEEEKEMKVMARPYWQDFQEVLSRGEGG